MRRQWPRRTIGIATAAAIILVAVILSSLIRNSIEEVGKRPLVLGTQPFSDRDLAYLRESETGALVLVYSTLEVRSVNILQRIQHDVGFRQFCQDNNISCLLANVESASVREFQDRIATNGVAVDVPTLLYFPAGGARGIELRCSSIRAIESAIAEHKVEP